MVEIADVFNKYGDTYKKKNKIPLSKLKVINAIRSCRTSRLGGHVDICDNCGHTRISYNSCRNRHCPKCQELEKEKWIEKRKEDLLPVQYFHLVFTLPNELNQLVLNNKKELYTLLFNASAETLKELTKDSKYLGANIGLISVLHTWGQNLMDHPHIHCIVTGGGLPSDKKKYDNDKLFLRGALNLLQDEKKFKKLINVLYKKDWVVYCKPSFKNPEFIIEYLGRYINKVAISNNRIIKLKNGKVTFKYKDYSDKGKDKLMTLDALEFIRRFLLHVFPDRFVRIRYYGLLSNRNKKSKLKVCRLILEVKLDNATEKEKIMGSIIV